MKSLQKKAVVVGALGVIGRYIVDKLLAEGDWQVVGLSRRAAKNGPRYSHVSVDLLDLKDVGSKLGGLSDVTLSSTPPSSPAPARPRTMPRWSRPTATCW
jgi:nucleoside-diphosphate-sugar epimerase